ncbi:MAG: hypothetical protein AAF789_10205, partial [Bacteroidota bacterium]
MFNAILGCERLRPDAMELPDYPDLQKLHKIQSQHLHGATWEKQVLLDSLSEARLFEFDSVRWKKELDFILDINPRKPEFIGAFEVQEGATNLRLVLKPKENVDLKAIDINYNKADYGSIKAIIHEEKDVFTYHRDIDISFRDGIIDHWKISGYQKVLL